jgi:hypothetical protein
MADLILSTVSTTLLLAGKVWRNLPAVYHPVVFASPWPSDPSTQQIPSAVTVGPRPQRTPSAG